MAIERRLYRLLCTLPLAGVLGVDSDFSKYRLLLRLTEAIKHKENFVNQYLKGKVNVLVYPIKYGQDQYVKADGNYEKVVDIERAVREYRESIEAVILPGGCLGEDFLFEVPGQWDPEYEFTFENSLYQLIFVESFPYGKENFAELINEAIRQYPYGVSKKILLYKMNVNYGATDVSSLDDAIDKTVLKLKKTIQNIQIFEETGASGQLGKAEYDLSAQYKRKKAKEIEGVKEFFDSGFEYEYSREATRYLNVGYDKRDGILSEQFFQRASDFKKIKDADNVEKAILSNYLELLNTERESINQLAKRLYGIYLARFMDTESLVFDDMVRQTAESIRKGYRCRGKKACPDTSIEYMVMCNKEGYIVKLKECVNESIEKNIHLGIKKGIERKLKECEAKYL